MKVLLIAIMLSVCVATSWAQPEAPICGMREFLVPAGGWRTLERFWNAKATLFFKMPKGAVVQVCTAKCSV